MYVFDTLKEAGVLRAILVDIPLDLNARLIQKEVVIKFREVQETSWKTALLYSH